jgi:hypothetical protein
MTYEILFLIFLFQKINFNVDKYLTLAIQY